MKGHYEGIDKKTMHAMKARKLASDVSLVLPEYRKEISRFYANY